jgi:hypothetical protein
VVEVGSEVGDVRLSWQVVHLIEDQVFNNAHLNW